MNNYYRNILFIVLIVLSSTVKSNNIDSLIILLNKTEVDSIKINLLIDISNNHDNIDTALVNAEKALKLAEKIDNPNKIAEVNMILGYIYSDIDFNEKAIEYYTNAEKYYISTNNKIILSNLYKDKGFSYEIIGDFNNAGKYYLKALELIEKQNDKIQLARILNNIGSIYYKQHQSNGALKYWNRSLIILTQLDYKLGIASVTSNIGLLYLNRYDSKKDSTFNYIELAQDNFQEALTIYKNINDSNNIYHTYNNLGNLFIAKEDANKALLYYKKALILSKSSNNHKNEVLALSNIGNLYLDKNNYTIALKILKEAENLAIEYDFKQSIIDIYIALDQVYFKMGNYKKAYNLILLTDSIKSAINDTAIAQAFAKNEKKYNYEKREKENEKLKITNQLQEEKNTKQRIFLIASIIGLLLLGILAISILRSYRQKRRANLLLTEQKNEITEKNEKLTQLNEEVIQQRDVVVTQKTQIEHIHTEITHSIKYAERIQTSTLPKIDILQDNFNHAFILFKPKDVVSGDFYWFTHLAEENITIATTADCTGHGVPGAFMSMLGISFLKEIVNKEYIYHPGVILRKLRKEIINALQQKGEVGEQKDGMDMALIAFNHKTKVLQFSGANNPVYIVSDELNILSKDTEYKTFLDENNKKSKNLYEIKPDKMPIAIYLKMDRFITHEIQLKEGDMVYMSSDGYADQFGGPKGKKLKYKPFKRLLLENSCENLEFQHNELDKVIEDWKAYTDEDNNNYEQVDDICIIGLRIE